MVAEVEKILREGLGEKGILAGSSGERGNYTGL
jgi:hypothetical protein